METDKINYSLPEKTFQVKEINKDAEPVWRALGISAERAKRLEVVIRIAMTNPQWNKTSTAWLLAEVSKSCNTAMELSLISLTIGAHIGVMRTREGKNIYYKPTN